MTLSEFRILIQAWLDSAGEAYLTDDDEILAVINRVLKQFAKDTLCLYSDNITWTLTQDVSRYSLRDSAVFSRLVAQPLRVWINGLLVAHVATSPDMAGIQPNYHTSGSGTPTLWWTQPPNHIVVSVPPAAAYDNSRVAGWYLPTVLEDETDVLDLPDEALDSAAIDVAIALLAPRATGDLLERVRYLGQQNKETKALIRRDANGLLSPIHIRRGNSRVYRLG